MTYDGPPSFKDPAMRVDGSNDAPRPLPPCQWCSGTGVIEETGIVCRTCGGSGEAR